MIQAPLRDLRESVTQLLYILSVETEKREQESAFYTDAAYSAGVTSTQLGPGRRRYDISKDQLEHLRSLFFSWQKIADMLQVSVSTIQRRRKEFGLDIDSGHKLMQYKLITHVCIDGKTRLLICFLL